MNEKTEVLKRCEFHIYGLLILLLIQCISLSLLNAFFKEFVKSEFIQHIVLYIIILICVILDLYFLINRIIILKIALMKIPIKCRIEDIIFIGYKHDKRTLYVPYFIVRSLENTKLYLTYDKYSLADYNTIFNYSDKTNIQFGIFNNDGIPVKLGDINDMYIYKTVNIHVQINYKKNTVKLNHKKIHFRHLNENIQIDIFNDIIFFKGAVCVESDK